jgi:alkaline phosphatase D
VLVSFDGFRGDYLDRYNAPSFQRLAQRGVRAKGLIPGFPSKTFPNHVSIVTGEYPGTHGITSNTFYDPDRKAFYSISQPNTVRDGSWYKAEPLWVTAERQGMVTASYFWVGSEAAIKGIRPATTMHFPDSVTNLQRVDTVLSWLNLPPERRPHFLTLYISDVDGAGHTYGPDDPHLQIAILAVDSALGHLMSGIDALPIRDRIYTVLVSDHGMAPHSPEQTTTVSSLLDTTGIIIGDLGPNGHFYVPGGVEKARIIRDSLNRHLQHGRAFLREELPQRLHYSSDPRGGDVVVMMDENYEIARRVPRTAGGNHGWDPIHPSMYGIFLVSGPGIKKGTMIAPFENIQVFPFLTEILGLKSPPGIDGKAGWLRHEVMQ